MTKLRMYSNWEILLAVVRRPRAHWRYKREGGRIFNGWWLRSP